MYLNTVPWGKITCNQLQYGKLYFIKLDSFQTQILFCKMLLYVLDCSSHHVWSVLEELTYPNISD